MWSKKRIGKKAKRQPVSKPDIDLKILPNDEHDSNESSWGYQEELQGNRNEGVRINSPSSGIEPLENSNEGGNTNTTKHPTEVKGFNADASEGGISFVRIPPATTTINTTTLQQTIISSLDPVRVRVWEQETTALENAGVINSPSHRLSDPALATMASMVYFEPKWWPEGMAIRLLQPLTKYPDCELLKAIIDAYAPSVMLTLREMYPQEKRKGSAFLEAQSLLPPSNMCPESAVHDWGGAFQGYIDTGKFSKEEARQSIDMHKKCYPRKLPTILGCGERYTRKTKKNPPRSSQTSLELCEL